MILFTKKKMTILLVNQRMQPYYKKGKAGGHINKKKFIKNAEQTAPHLWNITLYICQFLGAVPVLLRGLPGTVPEDLGKIALGGIVQDAGNFR